MLGYVVESKKMRVNRLILPCLLALTALASWPHWLWMMRRANDGSDDSWGIVALLTLLVLVWLDKDKLHLPIKRNLVISAMFTMTASATIGVLPPIVATALAIIGITWLIWGMLPKQRPLLPMLFLALLALPLVASLNFYLGYPLRWLCAQASALALSTLGLEVLPQGASLLWQGKTVLIDAPCAGIAMLWIGLYLAALFSYLSRCSFIRSCVNLMLAIIIVISANILRNTLLFYKEADIVHLPHWTHEAIGLLVFAVIVPLIYFTTTSICKAGKPNEIC